MRIVEVTPDEWRGIIGGGVGGRFGLKKAGLRTDVFFTPGRLSL